MGYLVALRVTEVNPPVNSLNLRRPGLHLSNRIIMHPDKRILPGLAGTLVLTSLLVLQLHAANTNTGSRVTFDPNGIAIVEGKPFFPIGMFTYELTPEVL